ncbi:MAG: hypothetical protein H2212_16355 [Ruminococcus sp.]|nr:hypothetical protein [Ruminococcus sp.]
MPVVNCHFSLLDIFNDISCKLVLVCHRSHPLSVRKNVRIKDILEYPFLVREDGSGTRELFQKELEKH